IVAGIGILFAYGYNRIVALEKRVEQSWADIDVHLKALAEKIPNFINVLKSQANFEQKTLLQISESYGKLMSALRGVNFDDKVKSANEFFGVFMPIVFQLPQFPQLQTNQTFRDMFNEIKVSIDKVAYARQFYNQAVQEYNVTIISIPWIIIAKLMNKKEKPYFTLGEEKRKEIESKLESGDLTQGLSNIV
ncbi:MAG: LemA family protein, partial [Candidatus Aenigmatarchaeota archaeon]